MKTALELLKEFLRNQPTGRIAPSPELSTLLAASWDSLTGPTEGGMVASKLHQRMESVDWSPPKLEFTIERHGGTVFGSTRAELQGWIVDVEQCTASLVASVARQLRKTQPRLDVESLVATFAALVLNGADDPRLAWSPNRTSVQVRIGTVVPAVGASQTVTDRRKRFCVALDKTLTSAGWQTPAPNRYQRG